MSGSIEVEELSKRYRHWQRDRAMTLQELFQRGLRFKLGERYWALEDVTFQVKPGRMVGVIGRNGAGKSTLLRLVAGVGRATSGTIRVDGRIGAMLELGAGFNPELTGRENIYASGVSGGLLRREVAERFDSIVAFSELEEFLEYPLRTYSTGMHMRLAFSVASHMEADVLLIDEVLAVGDLSFQRRCFDRLFHFKESGHTGMIVSHSADAILQLCDDAIWLDQGRIVTMGPVEEVVPLYVEAADPERDAEEEEEEGEAAADAPFPPAPSED
ncbi:MAG: ABC transporter ATP-binding protein [Planctomycetota bacterium]|nr:ABC transporter ATP-binding protein [Planctomycetota bacterium]MDP6764267.1 ABC transporter ATP-binding protein [Planctomycetota bacterium]